MVEVYKRLTGNTYSFYGGVLFVFLGFYGLFKVSEHLENLPNSDIFNLGFIFSLVLIGFFLVLGITLIKIGKDIGKK